ELIARAKARLSVPAWEFVAGGAETEATLKRNRYALDCIAFRPRVLRNVSGTDLATTFIGTKQRMPVLLAPLASLTEIHPDGALPIARAANTFGCLMVVSSVTRPGLDEVARAAGAIDLLPEVVAAAGGKAELVVDGGFVRGTDVLKGVARGAAMVGIGRLQALALGAAGEAGVLRMLELLETELRVTMKLLGVN